jgi:hypothetical protein
MDERTPGYLHVVLDDGNFRDQDVAVCVEQAAQDGDIVGHALAILLAGMTPEQRDKISQLA